MDYEDDIQVNDIDANVRSDDDDDGHSCHGLGQSFHGETVSDTLHCK